MTSASIRDNFPILQRRVRETPLVYLDSAATTQKPQAVLDAVTNYYQQHNANVHRAAHQLAEEATMALEAAREDVRKFVNAADVAEIIFTRGTTEAINLVASSLAGTFAPGDEILITALEHHSNIVPWQMAAQRFGLKVRAAAVTDDGEVDLEDWQSKLNKRTRLAAFGHVSNALGTVNPVNSMIASARAAGAATLLDGAQAALHLPLDVQALDCDFYAFSGHKMYAPTGIGVLYGKRQHLEMMPPWQGGGEMIETVTLETSTWNQLPYKFEAGTPNIGGAVGLGAAINYLSGIPREQLKIQEDELVRLAVSSLQQIEGVHIVGQPRERLAVVSFNMDGAHSHDIGTLLDQQGVAVRTGHHCAMPLMQQLGIPGTVRASFSLYNNAADVQALLDAVQKARSFL